MVKLAANLSFLFQEYSFLDRFEAAAKAGFTGVEFLFPYDWPVTELQKRLIDNGLTLALFNLSPGNWDKGERGLASLPDREQEFLSSVHHALDYAAVLGCKSLHVMAGLRDRSLPQEDQVACFKTALAKAVEVAAPYNITLMIEPINAEDMPGYLLDTVDQALQIVQEFDTEKLKLQFDVYHCQKIHKTVSPYLKKSLPHIGHIQIANPPYRHEPGLGDIDFPALFKSLDATDYQGWVGCEYKPSISTLQSLGWAQHYLKNDQDKDAAQNS
ncbi:MAG: 2-oxo-tetronate isomerase [Sneathiella sp.]